MPHTTLSVPLGIRAAERRPAPKFTVLSAIVAVNVDPQTDAAALDVAEVLPARLRYPSTLNLTSSETADLADHLRAHQPGAERGPVTGSWSINHPESRSSDMVGRLVLGEIDQSLSGNTILRVGRLHEDHGWQAAHHIVLFPRERDQLIALLDTGGPNGPRKPSTAEQDYTDQHAQNRPLREASKAARAHRFTPLEMIGVETPVQFEDGTPGAMIEKVERTQDGAVYITARSAELAISIELTRGESLVLANQLLGAEDSMTYGATAVKRYGYPGTVIGEVLVSGDGTAELRIGELRELGWRHTHTMILANHERLRLSSYLEGEGPSEADLHAMRVVKALIPDFPDLLADPAVARVLERKISDYVTDPEGRTFDWILDDPGIARWHLLASPKEPRRFQASLHVVNPSKVGRERAERVNARLAAL